MNRVTGTKAPTILIGQDGEPPTYINKAFAATPAEAIAFARDQGEFVPEDTAVEEVHLVLMRELDPIACEIRGLEHPWWVECTTRARNHREFWRIDA